MRFCTITAFVALSAVPGFARAESFCGADAADVLLLLDDALDGFWQAETISTTVTMNGATSSMPLPPPDTAVVENRGTHLELSGGETDVIFALYPATGELVLDTPAGEMQAFSGSEIEILTGCDLADLPWLRGEMELVMEGMEIDATLALLLIAEDLMLNYYIFDSVIDGMPARFITTGRATR